ncbi:MAG: hypothetical protein L6Q54_13800 [Leptospiraceae bacterium]|nr:hypothetical protein [Leptospiraceae bacterium]MCK6382308.1 hypothetical protein [Leptospiraceae bacterium]
MNKNYWILIFFSIYPIYSNETAFTYKNLLDQAERNISELRFEKAHEKLSIAGKTQTPDSRFFLLHGEVYLGLNYPEEALFNFEKSLKLNPRQPEILLKCSNLSSALKKPREEYNFLQGYLKFFPNHKKELYRVLVLASRLGIDKTRKSILLKLKSENPFKYELEAILSLIHKLILEKKFKEALIELDKYLPNFPDNESLHKLLLIATKATHPQNIEKILIDSAAIFKFDPKYTVEYGLFLFEKKKLFEALTTFRRAFLVSILTSGFKADEEILFFIRQVYFEMDRLQDVSAIQDLVEIVKVQENQSVEKLNSLIRLHNNNREILIFALFYLSEKGFKKEYEKTSELLLLRDKRMQDKEFIDVFGAFSYENLSIEKERPLE